MKDKVKYVEVKIKLPQHMWDMLNAQARSEERTLPSHLRQLLKKGSPPLYPTENKSSTTQEDVLYAVRIPVEIRNTIKKIARTQDRMAGKQIAFWFKNEGIPSNIMECV